MAAPLIMTDTVSAKVSMAAYSGFLESRSANMRMCRPHTDSKCRVDWGAVR